MEHLDNLTDCVTDVPLPGDWAGSSPQVVSLQLVSQDTFTTTAVPPKVDGEPQPRQIMATYAQPAVTCTSTCTHRYCVTKDASLFTLFHSLCSTNSSTIKLFVTVTLTVLITSLLTLRMVLPSLITRAVVLTSTPMCLVVH